MRWCMSSTGIQVFFTSDLISLFGKFILQQVVAEFWGNFIFKLGHYGLFCVILFVFSFASFRCGCFSHCVSPWWNRHGWLGIRCWVSFSVSRGNGPVLTKFGPWTRPMKSNGKCTVVDCICFLNVETFLSRKRRAGLGPGSAQTVCISRHT